MLVRLLGGRQQLRPLHVVLGGLLLADGGVARRADDRLAQPLQAAVAHEEEADARDARERRAGREHQPRLPHDVEQPAAEHRPKRLAEAVDGAGDALHDALLDGHVREERGEARDREAVADRDEGEARHERHDRRHVREPGEADRRRRHRDDQRALLLDAADDEAHEHALHEDAAEPHAREDEADLARAEVEGLVAQEGEVRLVRREREAVEEVEQQQRVDAVLREVRDEQQELVQPLPHRAEAVDGLRAVGRVVAAGVDRHLDELDAADRLPALVVLLQVVTREAGARGPPAQHRLDGVLVGRPAEADDAAEAEHGGGDQRTHALPEPAAHEPAEAGPEEEGEPLDDADQAEGARALLLGLRVGKVGAEERDLEAAAGDDARYQHHREARRGA